MRCAVLFKKIVQHGDLHPFVAHGHCKYPLYEWNSDQSRFYTGIVTLPAGTYTVTADLDGDITCKVYTYINYTAAGMIPVSGEGELPFTFTIPDARSVVVEFAYRGWGTTSMPAGAVSNVAIIEGSTPTGHEDVWETVLLGPDEIADSDTIAQTINCKSTIVLQILPYFEAWQFAEKSVTYVRVLDLDKPTDRIIFRGRVSAITDNMDTDGKLSQELTIASALDFFEDTSFFANDMAGWHIKQSGGLIPIYVGRHNEDVDAFRQFAYRVSGDAEYVKGGTGYGSFYSILSTVLTDGNLRRYESGSVVGGALTMEFREDFSGDVNTLEVAESFGDVVDTAIMIGDNLRSIRVEKAVQDALYTSVRAVTGVNSDGGREQATARNDELYAIYGSGHELLLVADDIKCTAPEFEYVEQGGTIIGVWSEAWRAMLAAIDDYAKEEAAKLSQTTIKLTISAADLATMGFSGYEPFEVGNSYPVVCPPLGLNGRPMRATYIRRRLSDGRVEQITIETGKAAAKSSGSLSQMVAQLEALNKYASDSAADAADIAATKAAEQTGGYKIVKMTKSEYDALTEYDDMTMYIVDNNGTTEVYIGAQLITQKGGGGDEPYIETACVLTSEQQTKWAPDHALVPVEFRGDASVYYGQAPSRFVVQGQRAYMGLDEETEITEADIMSELTYTFRDGSVQTLMAFAYRYSSNDYITMGVACINATTGAVIGQNWNVNNYWLLPASYQTVKIGFSVMITGFYLNSNGLLAPAYWIRLHVFADGTQARPYRDSARDLPYISGCLFDNGQNVDFGSAAERGFASGIAVTTEPVYPNGGE